MERAVVANVEVAFGVLVTSKPMIRMHMRATDATKAMRKFSSGSTDFHAKDVNFRRALLDIGAKLLVFVRDCQFKRRNIRSYPLKVKWPDRLHLCLDLPSGCVRDQNLR